MDTTNTFSRRSLLQRGAVLTGAGVAAGWTASPAQASEQGMHSIKKDDVILFQGDSITDAGRNKEVGAPNNVGALGDGYALMIASRLLGVHADKTLQCHNRGISGHKVPDLAARWQTDTLDLQPAVLSILIGVNDMWHKLDGRYDGTVEDYEAGFTSLLKDTWATLPEVQLVVCEPFALPCGAVNDTWYPEFDERRAAAKRVSDGAGATWVPFQSIFEGAFSESTPAEYWAKDGVHPTMAGHALMAKAWLEITGLG